MIECDLAIVGAGAAGLAAAIFAGEVAEQFDRPIRILLLDGARKLGAKILVSGGGRCNVTNRRVTPDDFWGGPRPLIRNVLRAFDEKRTIAWMESLGVPLKLEETGKYFPVSDSARDVLDALVRRARALGVDLRTGTRITAVQVSEKGFVLSLKNDPDSVSCRRLIMATGGLSLPKSGSDGAGLDMVRRFGHAVVPTTPALVPLVLRPGTEPGGRFAEYSGVTLEMRIGLYLNSGKRIFEHTHSLLFTHFGLSGPAALDFSRHWLRARLEHPDEALQVCLGHPSLPTAEAAGAWLLEQANRHPKRSVVQTVMELFPERLARAVGESAAPSCSTLPLSQLPRAGRLALARLLARMPVDVVGDRGYAYAETTAGGVDLREIHATTMESRYRPGLYLCGEMVDVDGRIGGFNFQWAWASGYLAGRAAVLSLIPA